jgi:hypothetical protein
MDVPLKFEVITDPEPLCALAFLPTPAAATRPTPTPIADRADKLLRNVRRDGGIAISSSRFGGNSGLKTGFDI